jgi:hypothetical protein
VDIDAHSHEHQRSALIALIPSYSTVDTLLLIVLLVKLTPLALAKTPITWTFVPVVQIWEAFS